MANATIDNLVSDLRSHAAAGVEGSAPAFRAASVLVAAEPPIYPEEASSFKERQFEDRRLLRSLATRALEGRTSDGVLADAVMVLNHIMSADARGDLADVTDRAERAAQVCLHMACLLLIDAPELVMRHQKQVTLRALEAL